MLRELGYDSTNAVIIATNRSDVTILILIPLGPMKQTVVFCFISD